MTRGQESLIIEEETLQITIAPTRLRVPRSALTVLYASPEDLAVHTELLAQIQRASGGACVWLQHARLEQAA